MRGAPPPVDWAGVPGDWGGGAGGRQEKLLGLDILPCSVVQPRSVGVSFPPSSPHVPPNQVDSPLTGKGGGKSPEIIQLAQGQAAFLVPINYPFSSTRKMTSLLLILKHKNSIMFSTISGQLVTILGLN